MPGKLGQYTIVADIAEGALLSDTHPLNSLHTDQPRIGHMWHIVARSSVSLVHTCLAHAQPHTPPLVAIHTLTGQRVALKCIRKASVNATFNPKAKVRVAREIEYLKLVNHPHVIKLCASSPDHILSEPHVRAS